MRKFFPKFIALMAAAAISAAAQTLAPGGPGKDAQWATAGKQGIGTSATLESKVWFTLAQGVMTEVYYPDVTTANVQMLQFIVVNPKTKKVETEQDDTDQEIQSLSIRRDEKLFKLPSVTSVAEVRLSEIYNGLSFPNSLAFKQVNRSKTDGWSITKTYITDPNSNSVLITVTFRTRDPDNELYVYYDPSLGNSGLHDTGWNQGRYFVSVDGQAASALTCGRCDISDATNGFFGVNDGLTQLRQSGKIGQTLARAENGNLVQVAKITPVSLNKHQNPEMIFALGFGSSPEAALSSATSTLAKGFAKNYQEYQVGWLDYLKSLPKVDLKYQAQFNMAAMQLKALEDKTHLGANIASLTVPWGGGANANENTVGGYHLVWARDLYQVFTAYIALGDKPAAERALDFLLNIQQKPDGSFPQNSWLDGKPYWTSLQMDEVAFPLIMAWQLGRFDRPTWENHIKKAADFIVKNGPKTPQERWEEEGGYSPSTIAAEIAGLVCAAEIAKKNGDDVSSATYLATADNWQANIEKWTATTTGKYGDGNYYLRITQNGKPDAGEKIEINNGAGSFDERDIVDAGFLELVRLGIKSPDDPLIAKSIKVIDQIIKVDTPNGPGFYRYNHDGYGEMDDGRRWNWDGKYTGKGRLWALLSGERGQFELAQDWFETQRRGDAERNPKSKIENPKSSKASLRLDAMLGFANEGLMIPEQVWDKKETPKNIDRQFVPDLKFGEGTGSAIPLAWSMAQFIRLAVNLKAGKNLDTPQVVYDRYAGKVSELSTGKIPNVSTFKSESLNQLEIDCGQRYRLLNLIALTDVSQISAKDWKPSTPVPEVGKKGATFFYRGDGKDVQVVGDFTSWKPTSSKMEDVADTNWKCIDLQFGKTARVEYKLIVDGKWITDPLNPNKIENGVGGENSVFTMPDYKPTQWDKGVSPKLHEFEIKSKDFGQRTIKVFVPSGGNAALKGRANNLPVIYIEDGSDYANRAKAVQIQKNLVKAGKIKPFIMVFIDPKDRMKEYWANDQRADFMAHEVVPEIDKRYRTIKSRDGRTLLGASLGGVTSIWTALKYPDIFGRVGGQSSSFWIDDERVVKELEKLDASKTKFRFYLDDGTLEGIDDSRKVVKILRDKGYDVTYVEGEAGHNWIAWRDRLADAFIALMK